MSFKLLFFAIFLCGIICIRLRYLDYRAVRFKDYLRRFNKSYSVEEFQRRLVYFEKSLEEIQKLNSGASSTGAVHGLTKFSDWSKQEFRDKFTLRSSSCENHDNVSCAESRGSERISTLVNLWETQITGNRFDWRDQDGVIGPIDEQKQCNGCWAFGIVRNMESMAAINKIGHDRLSVQQLLDCSTVNNHCQGGNIDSAMKYLCYNHLKLTTEDRYPLLLVDEDCKLEPTPEGVRGIKSFSILCNVADEVLVKKLHHGPVMVVVNPINWLNYISGVIQRNCFADRLSFVHVVQIVGYGTTTDDDGEEIPYFIIKNTWGSDWGEDGYMRIARGNKKNLCGIYNHIGLLDVD